MICFRRDSKYNIYEKLLYYNIKLNNLNILIEIAIKFNNKLYKLAIKTCYNNAKINVRPQYRYINLL